MDAKVDKTELIDALLDGFLQDLEYELDLDSPEEAIPVLSEALKRKAAQ